MAGSDLNSLVMPQRGLRPPSQDGALVTPPRFGRYGEASAISHGSGKSNLADEGSYFTAFSNQPGSTNLNGAALTIYTEATPQVVIQNLETAGGRRIYLDYIRLLVPSAGIAGVYNLVGRLDSNPRVVAGATPTTIVACSNGDVTAVSPAAVSAAVSSAITLTGTVPPTCRTVLRAIAKSSSVNSDEILVRFGATQAGAGVAGYASAGRSVVSSAPVVIGPRGLFTLHVWTGGGGAVAWELEVGFWAR